MSLDFLILAICSLAIILLGLLIISRNPTQKINRLFSFLAFSVTFWTAFNYFSIVYPVNLACTRLVFLGGVLTAFSLVWFVASFPSDVPKRKVLLKINRIFTAVMLPVVFLPQFIERVTKDSIITSYLYPLFIIYALFALVVLILIIKSQIKNAKLASQKQQVVMVSWGVLLYAVLAVVSNVLLPLFVNNWSSSRFGPIFSLLLVGVVAYSIIKHKLFDIRLIVARSVAYILTVATVGVFYSVVVFGLIGLFIGNDRADLLHQVVYVGAAIFLALSLQAIRKFFDKVSNNLFYRDNYDPQNFIDQLNNVLVSTIDLRTLIEKSSDIIATNLKSEFCVFNISKGDKKSRRQIGTGKINIDEGDLTLIEEKIPTVKSALIVIDDLGAADRQLFTIMQENNLSLIVPIAQSKDSPSSSLILLGPKKSGNPYNKQDNRVIGLIADELSIAIQNALRFEEIQKFNITLQEKITDATRELRHTNDKLKALDEAKDEFISMASHQLRTPLTSVKGYVSMVLEGDAGKIGGQQRQLLEQAFNSSQRMVYLIADLLNVSRLKTGKFVIDSKPTNLPEVIEGELNQLTETAKAHNLELTFEKPATFPLMKLDETKTRQVIMNFMDNAIYYTPPGGHIKVQLAATDKTIDFKVVDDGLGVPKSEEHHLFTKFFRAGNAKKARPDGTGLGLFMAKKVIIAQGGTIIFSSEEGKGSTFGFSFPRAALEVKNPV
ncbi:hypothetical protein BH10PAT3_BH10PAT3_2440 [soil metagenome]